MLCLIPNGRGYVRDLSKGWELLGTNIGLAKSLFESPWLWYVTCACCTSCPDSTSRREQQDMYVNVISQLEFYAPTRDESIKVW